MTTHLSHTDPAAPFSLAELKGELREFIVSFSQAMEIMVRPRSVPEIYPGDVDGAQVQDTWLWEAVIEMYKFGVLGAPSDKFGAGHIIDGEHADAEMFLRGLGSMSPYLEDKGVPWPKLAILTVRTAVARHALEGGDRYTDYEDSELNYLSLPEMALLANMDERSVRNAANPKLPGALKTVSVGKRTFVEREVAKQWLLGRKGFIPSGMHSWRSLVPATPASTPAAIALPEDLAARIEQLASAAAQAVPEYLRMLIDQQATNAPVDGGGANLGQQSSGGGSSQ